jgi:predicted site-specific integrase-resolvase
MKTLREQWNTEDRTLKQAASELGVHWRTVYRWTLMGAISFIQYRTNGPIFISQTEIKRLKKMRKALPGSLRRQ